MELAIVVPSCRAASWVRFAQEWRPFLSRVYLVEDGPERTLASEGVRAHLCWKDAERLFGPAEWIVSKRSDCVRVLGYYAAWLDGHDIILTLDDDCYPIDNRVSEFVQGHVQNLSNTVRGWWNTIHPHKPRGLPFQNLGKRPVVLSHGLWRGVPDYDAPTQLVCGTDEVDLPEGSNLIPPGLAFPMCGMNLAWRRDLTPAMYFPPMGPEHAFQRFGDIWAGLFAKRVCDHHRLGVVSGEPFVWHDRASDVWKNLDAEAAGLRVNEVLWEAVWSIHLKGESIVETYQQLAEGLPEATGRNELLARHQDYWQLLSKAMLAWVERFR